MVKSAMELTVQTFEVAREETIAAPVAIVFETMLEHFGPAFEPGAGMSLHMVLEPWPGGRWYRDLGNNTGHLWGHVQVIKPPTLIEICGPFSMSYPAVSHLQCRLTPDGDVTRLRFMHRAMGLFPPEHSEGYPEGWSRVLARVREAAERRSRARD